MLPKKQPFTFFLALVLLFASVLPFRDYVRSAHLGRMHKALRIYYCIHNAIYQAASQAEGPGSIGGSSESDGFRILTHRDAKSVRPPKAFGLESTTAPSGCELRAHRRPRSTHVQEYRRSWRRPAQTPPVAGRTSIARAPALAPAPMAGRAIPELAPALALADEWTARRRGDLSTGAATGLTRITAGSPTSASAR